MRPRSTGGNGRSENHGREDGPDRTVSWTRIYCVVKGVPDERHGGSRCAAWFQSDGGYTNWQVVKTRWMRRRCCWGRNIMVSLTCHALRLCIEEGTSRRRRWRVTGCGGVGLSRSDVRTGPPRLPDDKQDNKYWRKLYRARLFILFVWVCVCLRACVSTCIWS